MLYSAPINISSNFVYRHFLLAMGADYVFSELIRVDRWDKALEDNKLDVIGGDVSRTIFQLGVGSVKELEEGVVKLKAKIPGVVEININMGCPQSTMQQTQFCGGILYNTKLMGELANALSKHKEVIGSIKLRLGTSENTILIKEYLQIISNNGIKKVYIHARPLRYGYDKPCMFMYLDDLKDTFPDMNLIFNGDVDSFQSFELLHNADVLIGRAALSNPFIFSDIKNKKRYKEGAFNPLEKDPYIIPFAGALHLSKEKYVVILSYINLAIDYNLRPALAVNNLKYLLKGITNHAAFISEIHDCTNLRIIKDRFVEKFDSF